LLFAIFCGLREKHQLAVSWRGEILLSDGRA